MTASWKRTPYGYWSPDGRVFLERGAPMSDTGHPAWLVWVAVPDEWVDTASLNPYLDGPVGRYGEANPVRAAVPFADDGPDVRGVVATDARWYAHLADAGWLAEAKVSARVVLQDVDLRTKAVAS